MHPRLSWQKARQCDSWLTIAASLQVNPGIKKEKWSPAEDEQLLLLYEQHSGSWAQISRHLEVSIALLLLHQSA